jgi:CPA2 family monovalent cation:H+ antiporter-2
VVDYSSEQLAMLRRFGLRVYFGDATRPDLLHAAGIEEARILVIAMDEKDSITQLTRHVTEHYPHVHIVARAIDRWHVYDLWHAGCRDIIRETYDSSLRATRSVFEAMGYPRPRAERIVAEFETFDRKMMLELADLYDPEETRNDDSTYARHVRDNMPAWEAELNARMRAVMDEEQPGEAKA